MALKYCQTIVRYLMYTIISIMLGSGLLIKFISMNIIRGLLIVLACIIIFIISTAICALEVKERRQKRKELRKTAPWWKLKEYGGWI